MIKTFELSIPALLTAVRINAKWRAAAIRCLREIVGYQSVERGNVEKRGREKEKKRIYGKICRLFKGHESWYRALIRCHGKEVYGLILATDHEKIWPCSVLHCQNVCHGNLCLGEILLFLILRVI